MDQNRPSTMLRRVLSDDEELINGLGSQTVHSISSQLGNHMARTSSRWSTANSGSESRSSSNKRIEISNKVTVDGVHQPVNMQDFTSPGQLYSTDSGKLFHAGRIVFVLVGLPATSKTLLSVAITRYARWLGVRTESFHISRYMRDSTNVITLDEFQLANPQSEEGIKMKHVINERIIRDMIEFFQVANGQLAIYDDLNIRKSDRQQLQQQFAKYNVKIICIESIMDDTELVERNIKKATESLGYYGARAEEAESRYLEILRINKKYYEEMEQEENISFIKYVNFGQRLIVNNTHGGYLINKIVFFLMNLRHKEGSVYFARCGTSNNDHYIDDEELNEEGIRYSRALTEIVLERVKSKNSDDSTHSYINKLAVWTAPRKRTYDTAQFFKNYNIPVRQRAKLQQLHPGAVADLDEKEIQEKFPIEYESYLKDPYHFRFPRAESYHDLAVRMEPLLLEMEHMTGNTLIIAHESTLRVLYGYFMACRCTDLPYLPFTRDELLEISFSPFQNKVEKIPIHY